MYSRLQLTVNCYIYPDISQGVGEWPLARPIGISRVMNWSSSTSTQPKMRALAMAKSISHYEGGHSCELVLAFPLCPPPSIRDAPVIPSCLPIHTRRTQRHPPAGWGLRVENTTGSGG